MDSNCKVLLSLKREILDTQLSVSSGVRGPPLNSSDRTTVHYICMMPTSLLLSVISLGLMPALKVAIKLLTPNYSRKVGDFEGLASLA